MLHLSRRMLRLLPCPKWSSGLATLLLGAMLPLLVQVELMRF